MFCEAIGTLVFVGRDMDKLKVELEDGMLQQIRHWQG